MLKRTNFFSKLIKSRNKNTTKKDNYFKLKFLNNDFSTTNNTNKSLRIEILVN